MRTGKRNRGRARTKKRRRSAWRSCLRRITVLLLFCGLAAAAALVLPELSAVQAQGEDQPLQAGVLLSGKKGAQFVVGVDPGHGGIDVGALGGDLNEADVTWGTAQALVELLKQDDRFAVFLTKTQEETLRPSERAAVVRDVSPDLVVSIHLNSAPTGDASGFECYPVPPGRPHYEESLRFAQLLAQQFATDGAALRGEAGVRYLYYDAYDNKQIVEVSDTTVSQQSSFTLLEESGCPAVLAEEGFITNGGDMAMYGTEKGCAHAASLYYAAICAWCGVEPHQ